MQEAPIMAADASLRATPAIVVAQEDGRLIALDAGARRLLGNALGRECWRAVGALGDAEGLPCRTHCVRALLERGSMAAQHSRVLLRGVRHSLSCMSLDGRVVCLLSPASEQGPTRWQLLSAREREVLRLLSEGLTSGAIARRLELSEATVRTHVEHMREKLGVSTRAALVARGFALGFLG
jgi:DNA-binding CsgD family transcriptional regulator